MGQGLSTKVQQMVALELGCPLGSVFVHATSTNVIPQIGITGGSVGSETCVSAALKACKVLHERMAPIKQVLVEEAEASAKADGKEPVAPTFAAICAKAVGGMSEGFKINLSGSFRLEDLGSRFIPHALQSKLAHYRMLAGPQTAI